MNRLQPGLEQVFPKGTASSLCTAIRSSNGPQESPLTMVTFLIVLAAMLLLVGLMAVGVLFGRRPLQGSCGGLANLDADGSCSVCGRPAEESCRRTLAPLRAGVVNDPFAEPPRRAGR